MLPRLRVLGHVARMASRSLGSYRVRSALTALAVAMGVTTVVTVGGILEGLDGSFRAAVSSLGTGTLYVTRTPWIILGDWWRFYRRPHVTVQEADALRERLRLAEAVVPFVHHRATLSAGKTSLERVRIIGSTEAWPRMSGIEPHLGRFFSAREEVDARPGMVVGGDVAASLAREGIAPGDTVRLGSWPVRVVGLLPERGRILGQSQDDFVVIPLSLFERLYGNRRSISVGVVADPALLVAAKSEVTGALRILRRLGPTDESDFSVTEQAMLVDIWRQLTRALYAVAAGLAAITLIVAGVGIMNIMLVAVAERTREIGIRKALGARPGGILLQFLLEAALVSGLGGLAGALGGLALVAALAKATPLPAAVPPNAVLFAILFGAVAGLVFGLLPAWRASRLTPVAALASGG